MILSFLTHSTYSRISLFFLFSILITNCSTTPPHEVIDINQLQKLDSLAYTHPQQASEQATVFAEHNNAYENEALLIVAKAQSILGESKKSIDLLTQLQNDSSDTNWDVCCEAKFELGKMHYYQGEYDRAMGSFDSLLQQKNHILDSLLIGKILLFKGKTLRVKGDYAKSQICYAKSKNIAISNNDNKLLSYILISMGKNHIVEGNRELALQKYLEAYKLSEKSADYLLSGDVCNHLGGYYLQNNQHDKALEYHYQSLGFRQKLGAPDEIGQSYNNIGKTYLEMNANDSARYYFKMATHIFDNSHYMKGLVKSYTNLGKLSLAENDFTSAKYYLLKSYQLSNQSGYNLGLAETGIAMGNLYNLQMQPDSAIYYFKACNQRIQNSEYLDLLTEIYAGLYQAFEQKNDYKEALKYHEMLLATEKNRLNVENNRQLSSLLVEFDYERNEKDNRILKKENEVKSLTIRRNRLILGFAGIALLLTIILSLLIYSRLKFKEKANRLLQELNIRITQQNRELDILNKNLQRANQDKDKLFSIIAHELRNPLYWFQNLTSMLSKNFETMSSEKLKKSLTSIDDSAQNVYHLMDNLLFWSRSQLNRIVPRMSELVVADKIEEVIRLFKNIIETKEISLTAQVDKNLTTVADPELLACILRNLISNAIKFTPTRGEISIRAYKNQDDIVFEITDTGIGFSLKSFDVLYESNNHFSVPGILNEKGSGMGLKLCKEFVELHKGKIWIEPIEKEGMKVCFNLSTSIN